MPNFGDYQNEIYFAGLCGVVPSMRFEELEARAHEAMRRASSPTWPLAAGTSAHRTPTSLHSESGGWYRACLSGRHGAISRSSSSA